MISQQNASGAESGPSLTLLQQYKNPHKEKISPNWFNYDQTIHKFVGF